MTYTTPILITDPNGMEHSCDAVVENAGHELFIQGVNIPFSLHGQFYVDGEMERGMDVLVDTIIFNINEGRKFHSTLESGYSYKCNSLNLISNTAENAKMYLVGDVVNHIFNKTSLESVKSGALLFDDQLAAKTIAKLFPDFHDFEIEVGSAEELKQLKLVATSSVILGVAKITLNNIKRDYGAGVEQHTLRSISPSYFPDDVPAHLVSILSNAFVDSKADESVLEQYVLYGTEERDNFPLMFKEAYTQLVLNRFTVKEKDAHYYIPKTSSKGALFTRDISLNIDGATLDGYAVFHQPSNTYFKDEDPLPATPIALISPDGAGGCVIYNTGHLAVLTPLILESVSSAEVELGMFPQRNMTKSHINK